jgi:hypothetical protein
MNRRPEDGGEPGAPLVGQLGRLVDQLAHGQRQPLLRVS